MKSDNFIIMPKAFVGFDALVPFVVCLKEYTDCRVHCIFLNKQQYEQFYGFQSIRTLLKVIHIHMFC